MLDPAIFAEMIYSTRPVAARTSFVQEVLMNAFLDLAVLGKPEALKKFLPSVESLLPPDAHRDLEIEKRIKERFPDSRRCVIRWRRFSDDLMFPIDQTTEAICFDEVLLYPGKIVPAPGIPPLLADFFYRFVKPATEQLGLKYYSTAFEKTPPRWAKRRRQSAIEVALGWSVARQLLTEGYISRFPVRDETGGVPIDRHSTVRRLLEIYPACQN